MTKAVFLDRDGVINQMVPSSEGLDSPRSADEFFLVPGAAAAIRRLNSLGLPVVLVSNQPGIAKGKFSAKDLKAMTERMQSDLAQELAVIDGIYYCLHHPEAIVADYRTACGCRKPQSGLLTQAAREMGLNLDGSYMVGDQPRDVIAGKTVGCTTVLVSSSVPTDCGAETDHLCSDICAAAELITQLESTVSVH